MRRLPAFFAAASVLVLLACSGPAKAADNHPNATAPADRTALTGAAPRTTATTASLPAVQHVFVIVLENEGYAATFQNPSADPYLARTLPAQGALLTNYYGTGHESNDNYIAMISGQAPNLQTSSDCQIYSQFIGIGIGTAAGGQAIGTGCVYPSTVSTVANQLTAKGLSWKGYMEDMGNVAGREAPVCGHPALDAQDKTQSAVAGDGYATRHDPFVYFSSITDSPAYCDAHVVPLGSDTGALPAGTPPGTTGLAADLASASTTPNLSFITPNLCDDGHDYPCTNQKSGASALADIDTFLQIWVPKITSSPAFTQNGMLIITFDESDGPQSDSTACCNERPGPSDPLPGLTGSGGGRVGAVVMSPWTEGGTVDSVAYNHYSLLASIENLFGLSRLGYAATVPSTFGADVFNR
ncbi:MAG TPA: alkaline phosphatase family protein [Acidimicrobiales bacterium]|nr:alkaline phosphatase family protein [Acidimicrobiales bacterium]